MAIQINAAQRLAAAALINSLAKKLVAKMGTEMAKFVKTGTDEGRIILAEPLTAKQLAALKKLKSGTSYYPDGEDGNYIKITKEPKVGSTMLVVNVH